VNNNEAASGIAPSIAVVIPLHNKAAHIARAIESVLAQTSAPVEVIVVDDASTDGGAEVVRSFKDDRITLLHRSLPGPGGYAARNLGIAHSNAEFIAFLDGDDAWEENHLETFLSTLSQYPALNIYGASYRKHKGQGRTVLSGSAQSAGQLSAPAMVGFDEFLKAMIGGRQLIWTSATVVRREIFSKAGNFPEGKTKRGGDTDTWLRIAFESGGVAWSPKVTVNYFMDADNRVMQTGSNYEKKNLITLTCDDLLQRNPSRETAALLRKLQARKYYELSMARKRYAGKLLYSLPETRPYFFLAFPKNVLCIVPDFMFRAIKKS